MSARRLLSALGAAFCGGALVASALLRVPEVPRAPARAPVVETSPEAQTREQSSGRARITAPAPPQDDDTRHGDAGTSSEASPPPASPAWPTGGSTPIGTGGASEAFDEATLRGRSLLLPVEGVRPDELVDTFAASRGEGKHEALDILAPRRTRVRAVESGRIVKLFTSRRGGLTVYQFDPAERYCYYYAHLDAYAAGLAEGQTVQRGDLLGYVGTTGNAPPDTPHLHFAVFALGPERRWWEGRAIDPFPLFRN